MSISTLSHQWSLLNLRCVSVLTRSFSRVLPLVFALLVSACAVTHSIEDNKQLDGSSRLLIGEYGFWKRDCSDRHFDIIIDKYPIGGELEFAVSSLVVPEDPIIGTPGQCVGQEVTSKQLFYIAHRGFSGPDSISYTVKSSFFLPKRQYNVVIEVGR